MRYCDKVYLIRRAFFELSICQIKPTVAYKLGGQGKTKIRNTEHGIRKMKTTKIRNGKYGIFLEKKDRTQYCNFIFQLNIRSNNGQTNK